MLNDALQSSYSPQGQRSFNKRLKDVEGKVDSLKSNVATEQLVATKAEIDDLTVNNSLELNGDLNVNHIEFETANGNEITVSNVSSNTIETKSIDTEELKSEAVETDTVNSKSITTDELTTETATIKNLTVEEIIEMLNLRALYINNTKTLSMIGSQSTLQQGYPSSNAVLNIGDLFEDGSEVDEQYTINKAVFKTVNRPMWNNLDLVTKDEMVTSPLKYWGSVNTELDFEQLTGLEVGDVVVAKSGGPNNSPIYNIVDAVDSIGMPSSYTPLNWPILANYRDSANQDIIDKALQKAIDNVTLDLTDANTKIDSNYTEFKQHEAAQQTTNTELKADIDNLQSEIVTTNDNLDKKLSDAPIDGQLYGRRNGVWSNIVTDGAYVPKHYDKVEHYFSDITLVKDAAYLETSQLVTIETPLDDGSIKTTQYYLALWKLQPSDNNNFSYTTKNAYDFINQYKDKINEPVFNAINSAFEDGHIIGQNNKKEFQTLDWLDVEQPFGTTKEGDTIERPDGEILGTNDIVSDDNGVDINSTLQFTANTPTTVSDERSVINRRYIKDNLKLSMESSSALSSSAVLTFNRAQIDGVLDRANCYKPNAQYNAQWMLTNSPWMHRTKDYVYYKVDNVVNQSASSFSFWFSIDKDGNVINMTNPREDRGNAVSGQSDSEMWMTYHPSSWDGVNDNYAYWPHTNETYGGYITIFNNGRFAGYVEDKDGNSNNLYTCNNTSQSARWVGGKSLRGEQARILMVNSSSSTTDNIKAGLIGLDMNNEEGLNKFRSVQLPNPIKWGVLGLASGNKHWFAQGGVTNSFMVISSSGAVASYVLTDPVTQEALTANKVENGNRNYIELDNGDCIFAVRDDTTKQFYFVYCNDNFEAEGIDPFTVYRSSTDYIGSTKWPLVAGNPFVEFGNFVYFFPTMGEEFADTWANPANITLTSTYSRFNKTTKSWSDALLNWTNDSTEGAGVRTFKTHDPIEDADYLWVFQGTNAESSTSPTQAQCLVISESGSSQYVDLGTGSSIHWFNNTIKEGESKLASYSYPLNYSGTASWGYKSIQRPNIPFAAVTQEGIGIMFSNSLRDVCIFYGNGHFAIYSYSTPNEGGPWSYFTDQNAAGPAVIGGKYGVLINIRFNNNLVGSFMTDTPQAYIYVKPTGSDYLGEPQFFWKPTQVGDMRAFYQYNDGMDYAETDFSNYKKGKGKLMTDVTPIAGQWEVVDGMTNYYTEKVSNSSTLYLRDGNNILSQVNIK